MKKLYIVKVQVTKNVVVSAYSENEACQEVFDNADESPTAEVQIVNVEEMFDD